MKLSRIGRVSMALVVSVAMGLGMTACGGGTIGFMWVLGTQYNQIAAFKIDDFTGNLTVPPGSPFGSGGTNPVSLVLKPGGRFLYVINKGTALPPDVNGGVTCQSGAGGGNIAEFSVGGQGVLTFQQNFVEHKDWRTLSRKHCGGSRPAFAHHQFEKYTATSPKSCNIGCSS